jgi:hypothetical protein
MGYDIWTVLKDYAGRWVAVDAAGKVLAHARDLSELKGLPGARTILFAAA